MDRRSFVSLTALSGAVLVLPNALGGCGSAEDPMPTAGGGAMGPGQGSAGAQASASGANAPVGAPVVVGKGALSRRFSSPSGDLFDVYPLEDRVDFLTPGGVLRTRVTTDLNTPIAVAIDGKGRVLVLQLGAGNVQAYTPTGGSLGAFAAGVPLRMPSDLAVNTAGVVAIADTLQHTVVLLDAGGTVTGALGSFGTGSGGLNGPAGVAFAANGSAVYVADQGNARVQVFSPTGRSLGSLGGYGTSAGRFLSPSAVRVDAGGSLYVADPVGGFVSVYDAQRSFVRRFRPTLPTGAAGVPLWLSAQTDGSILVGAITGATA